MQGYFRRRGCKCSSKRCTCGATWSFSIDLGRDPSTGKRKQKTVSGFKTKKEAQLAAARIVQELTQGTFVNEKSILLSDFIEEWFKYYQNTVKVSTVRIRRHESEKLNRYFKGYQLKNITKKMYQDFINSLKEEGLASNTLSGIHSTSKMIFTRAIELEIIKNNPTQFAKLPKFKKTVEELEREEIAIRYLEKEELDHFLKTAKYKGLERDYVIFLTLAYSGLRVGELCALKWTDLDFINQTVSITKTYYNPQNKATEYHLLTPKTATSRRIIELDSLVFMELEKHKKIQNEIKMRYRDSYYAENFVFAKVGKYCGYPEFIKTIQNRMRRILKIANLNENLTPHSLRHTHTSLLAEAGVSIYEIMERLGHHDDEMTKRVYLHVTKSMKKEASHKFRELMKDL
ncbi:site-specific integrase [Planococcus halotolerans]|uniref:site-specific integrase n=1 Tax=Planococcus halotolerans TaxID=2233542 RepID=UPI0010929990|nr:site-specific integrase [Planococcus halotolerans]QHJ69229.1 tyrosine-type recombinase/integrase [Planococcus halotolerans]